MTATRTERDAHANASRSEWSLKDFRPEHCAPADASGSQEEATMETTEVKRAKGWVRGEYFGKWVYRFGPLTLTAFVESFEDAARDCFRGHMMAAGAEFEYRVPRYVIESAGSVWQTDDAVVDGLKVLEDWARNLILGWADKPKRRKVS